MGRNITEIRKPIAGHETNPVFFDKNVRKIMANAVKWAAPRK